MFFARGYAHEPVAVTEVVVREAALFGAEEQGCAATGGNVLAQEPTADFETMQGMVEVARPYGRSAYDERAVGDGLGDGCALLGIMKKFGSANRGPSLAKVHLIAIHDTEVEESEVAHSAGGRSNVEWIAGGDEHNDDVVELVFIQHGGIQQGE
jgi:hypothetical protein